MPYGFVRIFFFFFFFRRQGFRMITFDRQAGSLQNFNRSHVMVIGRSVLFSHPVRPPSGGVGRPKHPKIPPPSEKKNCMCFRTPGTFLVGKTKLRNFSPPPPPPPIFFFWVLRPQEDVFAEKNSVAKNFNDQYTYMSCPLTIYNNSPAGRMHIYAYNTLGYHHLFRSRTLPHYWLSDAVTNILTWVVCIYVSVMIIYCLSW